MATFSYETKQGIKYGCRGYLGIDEMTGKQVNLNKRGFDTRKDADVYFMREKLKFADGERKKKATVYTFQEVYEQWLEVYRNTVKESTYSKLIQYFDLHILPKFGDLIISKITANYIQKVVNEWHPQFFQYKRMYNHFKRIMHYAMVQGHIKDNPCRLVVVPTKKIDYGNNKDTKDFYSKNELQHFLKTVKKHESYNWYAMFRLLAFTGIRRGELLALTWKDINFNDETLDINKTLALGVNNKKIIQSPKTDTSIRTITLDKKTIKTLKKWRFQQAELLMGFGHNASDPNQLVFSQLEKNVFLSLSTPRGVLLRLKRNHSIDIISIHGFRHTHCSLLFEAGVPMKDVMERLGHSNIKTTMNIYTHVTKDSRNKSAEMFAKYADF